jgi:fatty-acyl-CoA synthase
MMNTRLSLNHLLERAGRLFHGSQIVSRLPDKSAASATATPSSTAARARWARRCRPWALRQGERVATLCWNHHAHLECYFGIPAAGGVMHTLNLRLSPEEIGWIAADARTAFC